MASSSTPIAAREYATRLGACVLVGAAIWFAPRPEGLSVEGWHTLAVFAATIASFVLRPLPMGPMVLIGLMTLAATKTLSFKTVMAGFGESVVWLVVAAFLIAGAVRRTGLGRRIALLLVSRLGRSTRGLGYALCGSELVLGPVVPSNTARGGGIMAPIVGSLSHALDSTAEESPRRAGEYLVLVAAHANLITAAMFLTGMAANPIVAAQARDVLGIDYDWLTWAKGALVPGLAGLLLLPWVMSKLARPELTDTSAAQAMARSELDAMGSWTRAEKVMAGVFVLLIFLWCTKDVAPIDHGMGSALVAWIGVCVLLISRTESWKDVCGEPAAWDTLVWLGGLLAMATALKDAGVIAWFADAMEHQVTGMDGLVVALVLALVYFYSMYGFSMLTGHITALAGTFFAVSKAADAPALLIVPLVAAFSNLCGCTTNYSTGPVVIYFGMGYVPAGRWFRVGFFISLFHVAIWLGLGLLWWKVLGWW